ncbi:MAG TPA: hypothetical protein VGG64_26775 [Pirellulales bacterium]|jgi:hypothetical protein
MKPAMLFALLLCLGSAGCWSSERPSIDDLSYDSSSARTALLAALDAWKQGRAAELARRKPPIRFADEDYIGGWRLTEYQLVDPEQEIRPFQGVRVNLLLKNRKGQTAKRLASYQVSIRPGMAVLRSDP